jgi:hypothetical protein
MSHWLTRFLLVAALVFSQALYAGHGLYHVNGDQTHCQICLQASSGGAALLSSTDGPLCPVLTAAPVFCHVIPVTPVPFTKSHLARAPPTFSV